MTLPRIEVSRRAPETVRAEGLLMFRFEGAPLALPAAADRAAYEAAARRRRHKGARGETLMVPLAPGKGARLLLVAGLGAADRLDAETLHRAAAAAARLAQQERVGSLVVAPPRAAGKLGVEEIVRAVAEGLALGAYRFEPFLTEPSKRTPLLDKATICVGPKGPGAAVLAPAAAVVAAAKWARDVVNLPAAEIYPETMAAEIVRAVAGTAARARVFEPARIEREGMNALLAVGRGSERTPRVVHVVYKPRGRAKARVAFVGKGVTFDAGGYDLKNADGMDTMKCDMGGAAAAVGALVALARMKAPVEVHAVVGLVENLVSGRSYKPGDVLVTRAGKTVEVNNTDAEGRLVLADLLDYAKTTVKADAVVDVATLTGACCVALGNNCSGLFSNSDALAADLAAAAARAGEKLWRLPLIQEYRDGLKSDVADMKNTGGRFGGAITAALFLETFADAKRPWAHLDIAGPAFLKTEDPFFGKGATAAGLATLVEYALAR